MIDNDGHDNGPHGAKKPNPIAREQVKRKQARNERPANIDGDDCAGPVDHDRHDITHAEEIDHLV